MRQPLYAVFERSTGKRATRDRWHNRNGAERYCDELNSYCAVPEYEVRPIP